MNKLIALSVKVLCLVTLCSTTLLATEPKDKESYLLMAGTKRLSKDEDEAIKEQRALKALQTKNDEETDESGNSETLKNLTQIKVNSASGAQEEVENLSEKITNDGTYSPEKITNGAYYFTSHEGAIHTAYSVSEFREKIKLNDGTIWSVSFSDRWKLIDWLITDGIFILPKHSFFSIYNYVLVNQRTGDYVDVNLCELEVLTYDPTYYGNRKWIIDIDYFGNYITLNDYSVWDITFDDDSIMKYWRIGDVVTIGINDGWDSTLNPNLLIHFDSLNYVRADCLN